MMKDSEAEKMNGQRESLWNYFICLGAVIGGIVYFHVYPKLIKDTPILIINCLIYGYCLILYTVITYIFFPTPHLFTTHPSEGFFGYLSSWNKFFLVFVGLGFFGGFLANSGYSVSLLVFTP